MAPNSAIVWRGPSAFTGNPVRVLLTGLGRPTRQNPKTGPMVQAWIIPEGNPSLALGTPRERDVCGTCRLQGGRGPKRLCYTATGVWLIGQHEHLYSQVSLAEGARALAGKAIRLGAYGDPAAVPLAVWEELVAGARRWTGYTHAWRTAAPGFRRLLMASVDGYAEGEEARAAGWRTFRVRALDGGTPPGPRELVCSYESRGVPCVDCGLCAGQERPGRSVVITAHGMGAARFQEVA
jgi:hypothetical protein